MADEVKMVEVNEAQEAAQPQKVSEAEAKEMGLSEAEVKLGIEQGDIAKTEDKSDDKESKKADTGDKDADKSNDEGKEDRSEDGAGKDKQAQETDEDDDPEKEQETVKDFSPNEKALYFKQKKEKQKRQAAERAKDLYRVQLEAAKREAELLKQQGQPKAEDNTPKDSEEDDEKIVTVGDLKKQEQAKEEQRKKAEAQAKEINARLNLQEAEAKSKYDDFDAVCDLAKEVMHADKYGVYAHKMAIIAADPNGNVAEYVYEIGKANPKYRELSKDKQPAKQGSDNKKVEKIVANASKRTSSASMGGGSGTRSVSEADLTVEDTSNMTQGQWDKLSPATRERLLRESCGA